MQFVVSFVQFEFFFDKLTLTDTIMVLAVEDVSKAFAALTDLITEARKQIV